MSQRLRRAVRSRAAAAVAVTALAVGLVINAPGIFGLYYDLRYTPLVQAMPEARTAAKGDRLLVIAPHPDDETLCCAGSILKAERAGARVFIVWLTSGDGFELDAILLDRNLRPGPKEMIGLGEKRMREARAAAGVLGVSGQDLRFLGYPDGGLLHLFLEDYSTPYRSRYTRLTAVPYAGTVAPGSTFTGANLERDLEHVVEAVSPTLVLAPSPLDAHPDHRAAGNLALRILGSLGETNRLRFWIVHGGLEWPLPKRSHPGLPLGPPPRGHGLPWQRVDLSDDEEKLKGKAIAAYRSQTAILGAFMAAFVRHNELLSPKPLPESSGSNP